MSTNTLTGKNGCDGTSPSPQGDTVEQLFEQVASGRVTVQRVLEYLRDGRDADQLKGSDVLSAIHHVRRDLDEALVIVSTTPDPIPGAVAYLPREYGRVEMISWNAEFGSTRRYIDRREVEARLHKRDVTIRTVEDAWDEFRGFIDEHSSDDGGDA